ncbi:MAG: hypothetical protein HYR84_16035, partial [Planctomycetes bacterium]|nr:hypothetical protein [Planctomycetota bacterium]
GERWLEKRDFALHIAHRGGIQTWRYPPGCITAAQALHYFVELTRDFLDPGQFDLLPFDVINGNSTLKQALHSDSAVRFDPEEFRSNLQEEIAEASEKSYGRPATPVLVEMIHAEVPADALAKVQRRFHLLDRGPAALRQQPKGPKGKRGPKK